METIKLRSKAPLSNLDAINGKDAYLTATFTDIKVLPFSGVIRYFGEFYKYDENDEPILESVNEVEIFNKRENLDLDTVNNLFTAFGGDFSQGLFSKNLMDFVKIAFKQKIAADGRYKLGVDDLEIVEEE
jgi:hypothetical protein